MVMFYCEDYKVVIRLHIADPEVDERTGGDRHYFIVSSPPPPPPPLPPTFHCLAVICENA